MNKDRQARAELRAAPPLRFFSTVFFEANSIQQYGFFAVLFFFTFRSNLEHLAVPKLMLILKIDSLASLLQSPKNRGVSPVDFRSSGNRGKQYKVTRSAVSFNFAFSAFISVKVVGKSGKQFFICFLYILSTFCHF